MKLFFSSVITGLIAIALLVGFYKAYAQTVTLPIGTLTVPECSQIETDWSDVSPLFLKRLGLSGNPQFMAMQAKTKAAFVASVSSCTTAAKNFKTAFDTKNAAGIQASYQAASAENSQQSNMQDAFHAAILEMVPGQNVSKITPTIALNYTGIAFAKGTVVHYQGVTYIASADTTSQDVPGVSALWTKLIWGSEMRTLIGTLRTLTGTQGF